MPDVLLDERNREDAAFMARVQFKDTNAFGMLFDRYHRLVFAVAHRVVLDESVAEDIVQSVFLKVWKTPDAFRGGVFVAWITSVSRNSAIDERRRRQRANGVSRPADPERSACDEVIGRLEEQRLHRALRGLPRKHRDVIDLNFFAGLTHTEIADRTAIPLGTVKTRIRAGIASLRRGFALPADGA